MAKTLKLGATARVMTRASAYFGLTGKISRLLFESHRKEHRACLLAFTEAELKKAKCGNLVERGKTVHLEVFFYLRELKPI